MPTDPEQFSNEDSLSYHADDLGIDLSMDKTLGLKSGSRQQTDDDKDKAKFVFEESQKAAVLRSLERVSDSRYLIFDEIGRGGMGIVFRAKDKHLQRDVAMKVISPGRLYDSSYIDRFIEEAQISSQLQHPSIVPVYDIGKLESGHLFFTMKLIKGETFAGLLHKRTSASDSFDHHLGIFVQICQAVAFAHSKQVIHRDLKPSNVMVGRFGEVHVMDWGLAKVQPPEASRNTTVLAQQSNPVTNPNLPTHKPTDQAAAEPKDTIYVNGAPLQSDSPVSDGQSVILTIRRGSGASDETDSNLSSELEDLTEDGSVLGTVTYMSPEQASGHIPKVDSRSDVFSLGAILCEIITGEPPYQGVDKVELLQKAVSGSVTEAFQRIDAAPVQAEIREIAKACLAPDPGDRPPSAGELFQRLEEILASNRERSRVAELDSAATMARLEEAKRTIAAERRNQRMILLASLLSLSLFVAVVGGNILLNQRESLRVSQNGLALEQFRVPALNLVQSLWNAPVMPASTEFDRLASMKSDLELASSQMDVAPALKGLVNETLQQIAYLGIARQCVLHLDQVFWNHNTYAGVYDPAKLLDGVVSYSDRNLSRPHQLAAYQQTFKDKLSFGSHELDLETLTPQFFPRWALEEIEVALNRFKHLCHIDQPPVASIQDTQRSLDLIEMLLDKLQQHDDQEKMRLSNDLWDAIFNRDIPRMVDLAMDSRLDTFSIPTRQALAKALLDYGPGYYAESLQSQIDWKFIESRKATEKSRAQRVKDGSVSAFEIVTDLTNDDVLAVRLDTLHDLESGMGPGEKDPQRPTDDKRCLVDELSFARQSSDGTEFMELEVTNVVSSHPIVPGREIRNAVDHSSGTFWSVTHSPKQSVASAYFFIRPIRTVRYPVLRIRVDNGHPEFRQITSLGEYRIYYANRVPELQHPVLAAEQLIQRLPAESQLTPRVQMTVAEIESMTADINLDAAVSTASMAYRQSPHDQWMSELYVRLATRLPQDSPNSWLTELQRNLVATPETIELTPIRRKLGAYYSWLGDEYFNVWHQQSLLMYQQALSVDPSGFKRHGRLGERLRKTGKMEESQSVMESGIKIASEIPENWFYLGRLIYELGDYHRSASLLEQAVTLDSASPLFCRWFCRALLKANRIQEGLAQFENLKSKSLVDHGIVSLAVSACYRTNLNEQASEIMEWWADQQNQFAFNNQELGPESGLSTYYEPRSVAWYQICLSAIDSELANHRLPTDSQFLQDDEPKLPSLMDRMLADPQLDLETIFAMIDRFFYGRETTEPAETLSNLTNFLKLLEERLPDRHRVWIRQASAYAKRGEFQNSSHALRNISSDKSNPYSAFRDITQELIDENNNPSEPRPAFVFPSDRTQHLPDTDRDLAEWLWWDRSKPSY